MGAMAKKVVVDALNPLHLESSIRDEEFNPAKSCSVR